jgi:hypothetical protein
VARISMQKTDACVIDQNEILPSSRKTNDTWTIQTQSHSSLQQPYPAFTANNEIRQQTLNQPPLIQRSRLESL